MFVNKFVQKMFFSFINLFSRFKKCSCFKKLSKFVLRFKICSQDSKNVRTFKKYLCSNFVLNLKILFSKFKKCSRFYIFVQKMFFSFINIFSRFKKCSCFKKLSKFVLCFKICSQDSKNVRTFRKYLCSNFVLNFKILFSKFKICSGF